jgi:hypothetical protein
MLTTRKARQRGMLKTLTFIRLSNQTKRSDMANADAANGDCTALTGQYTTLEVGDALIATHDLPSGFLPPFMKTGLQPGY